MRKFRDPLPSPTHQGFSAGGAGPVRSFREDLHIPRPPPRMYPMPEYRRRRRGLTGWWVLLPILVAGAIGFGAAYLAAPELRWLWP